MESEDYSFYQGLVFLLENNISDLGYDLTFATEVSNSHNILSFDWLQVKGTGMSIEMYALMSELVYAVIKGLGSLAICFARSKSLG